MQDKTQQVKLDSLIESFAHSFGRVVEIGSLGFMVLFSYTNKEIYYSFKELNEGLITLHN